MNDLAIDCALTLNGLIYKVLNPLFYESKYPHIDVRIGIDSGEAYVQIIGNPSAKQHKDIIGQVVSLAAKIQSKANPGEIFLGEVAVRHLHIYWREKCIEVKDLIDWHYKDTNGQLYKIYKMESKA